MDWDRKGDDQREHVFPEMDPSPLLYPLPFSFCMGDRVGREICAMQRKSVLHSTSTLTLYALRSILYGVRLKREREILKIDNQIQLAWWLYLHFPSGRTTNSPHCSLLGARCWWLNTDYWLVIADRWLLSPDYWIQITEYWILISRCSLRHHTPS